MNKRIERPGVRAGYDHWAETYDTTPNPLVSLDRCHTIQVLAPQPGERILDAGCGTGLNFPLLEAAVGEGGRVIGVDLSPDMLVLARERVSSSGWHNVTLIESSLDEAHIPGPVDAALLFLTHDVMRSSRAIENVIASVVPGGRIVAATIA